MKQILNIFIYILLCLLILLTLIILLIINIIYNFINIILLKRNNVTFKIYEQQSSYTHKQINPNGKKTMNLFLIHGILNNSLRFNNFIKNFSKYVNNDYKVNFYSINIKYNKNYDPISNIALISHKIRKIIIKKSNKGDINNICGFSIGGFISTFIFTKFKKKDININYKTYINRFNEFKNINIANLCIMNTPFLTNSNGLYGAYNAIIFKLFVPLTVQFYKTKLGNFLKMFYYKLIKINDDSIKFLFLLNFIEQNDLHLLPKKLIKFNYLHSYNKMSSFQNIKTILNNTNFQIVYGKYDFFINKDNIKYINNSKCKYFITNTDHNISEEFEFYKFIINNFTNENNNNNNKYNYYNKNKEIKLKSYYYLPLQKNQIDNFESILFN